MRWLWFFAGVFAAVSPAHAAVIGGPLLRDGMEIVPQAVSGVELDRAAAGLRDGVDAIFLMADVRAGKDEAHGFAEHAFIPYLSVSYSLTKDDLPTFKKSGLLYPVATKAGPRYGAGLEMAGPGTYRLRYILSPPSTHGMMRQTGKDGVADWWKPITANWVFTYPLSAK